MQRSTLEQRYLDVHAASIYLGMSEKAIRYKIESRTLPFTRAGHSIRFDRLELDKFLAGNAVKPLGAMGGRR